MRKITDLAEVRDLLSKYEFEMFNRANSQKGEITTLDKKDIDDIIGDMYSRYGGAVIHVDDNDMVIIKYPSDVCRLESRSIIREKTDKL
jgi:hypothetical protein